MKVIKKIIVLLFAISFSSMAQNEPKTGYTNIEYLISKLPEVKKISEELEKQKKQYDILFQQKGKEFQDKLAVYQKSGANLPEIIKKDKEKELQTMQTSMQELQQNAEKDLQTKQAQMVQPLYVKVYSAIQAVAEEKGFKFIFNTGDSNQARNMLVAPADGDVSELVLKKMGANAVVEKAKDVVKPASQSSPKADEAKPAVTKKPTKAPAKPTKKK